MNPTVEELQEMIAYAHLEEKFSLDSFEAFEAAYRAFREADLERDTLKAGERKEEP